jgi:hypothetical protein
MRRWRWILVAVVVIGVPIAWYLGSPLFVNRVVNEPATTEAIPAGAPATVAQGSFVGADDFHKGEGTATLYRAASGHVLRLDAFKVTNGPDLHVILTKHPMPRTRADVQQGYVEVAKLKGNIGSQNYTLPAGLTLADYQAVVIYCKPFHVVFATARLQPTQ